MTVTTLSDEFLVVSTWDLTTSSEILSLLAHGMKREEAYLIIYSCSAQDRCSHHIVTCTIIQGERISPRQGLRVFGCWVLVNEATWSINHTCKHKLEHWHADSAIVYSNHCNKLVRGSEVNSQKHTIIPWRWSFFRVNSSFSMAIKETEIGLC